jgi:hypothetical protein
VYSMHSTNSGPSMITPKGSGFGVREVIRGRYLSMDGPRRQSFERVAEVAIGLK